MYSTLTSPVPSRSPQFTPRLSSTCVNSATSDRVNTPARTKYALAPTSSSATPGQMRIVPGSRSRSRMARTARAAVICTARPELCPSPWPGAPSTMGARQATPGYCDAAGIPSMSLPSEITGLPDPHVAIQAVGIPATPSSTVNPLSRSIPTRNRNVSVSWNPSSPKLKS